MITSAFRLVSVTLLTVCISVAVILACALWPSERLFFALVKFYSRSVLAVCGIRVAVEGSGFIESSRSYIFVANHASLIDIPAVVAGIPCDVRIIYKKELELVPLLGWGLRIGKTYIPIDRANKHEAMHTMEEVARKIARGSSVLIFGEGTRTRDGKLLPFKRGAFSLAVKAGIPVVPLTINGSFKILPKGSLRIRSGTIALVVEKPIEPPPSNGRHSELNLRDEVRDTIGRHYREQ